MKTFKQLLVLFCLLSSFSQIALSQVDNGEQPKAKQGNQIAQVQAVLPSGTTRVLIRDVLKKSYTADAAQKEDAKIRITATVTGKKGQKIYFEVVDPDDLSSYEKDTDPNDNKDATKNGRDYQAFQNACLSAKQVEIGSTDTKKGDGDDRWIVWITLSITSQHSGDNYKVRATGVEPDATKPFDQQPALQLTLRGRVVVGCCEREIRELKS